MHRWEILYFESVSPEGELTYHVGSNDSSKCHIIKFSFFPHKLHFKTGEWTCLIINCIYYSQHLKHSIRMHTTHFITLRGKVSGGYAYSTPPRCPPGYYIPGYHTLDTLPPRRDMGPEIQFP